jgi:NTP pyrophosphatase (non-canonical NTP hydrolase)
VIGRTLESEQGVTPSVPTPAEPAYTEETLGEVLFALVAAARAAGIDPEQALRQRVRLEIDAIRAAEQTPGPPTP